MKVLTTMVLTLALLLTMADPAYAQISRSTVHELDATELMSLFVAGAGRGARAPQEYQIASSELNRRIRSGSAEERRDLEAAIIPLLEAIEPVPVQENPEISGLLLTSFRLAEYRPNLGNRVLNIATEWFEDPEDPRLSMFLLTMNKAPEELHPALINRVAALIQRSDLQGWQMQVAVSALVGFEEPGVQRLRALESSGSVPEETARWIRFVLSRKGG